MTMAERNEDRSTKMTMKNVLTCIVLVLLSVKQVQCSDNDDISDKVKIIEKVSGRFFSDVYQNGTFRTGNALWDNILNKCTVSPSVSCLQKNVYSFLDDKLGMNDDVEVTSGVCFKKNNVDVHKYSKEANTIYLTGSKKEEEKERYLDEENEIEDEEPESPLEEITDALYDKSVKFLVTHDMKLTLPQTYFHGATVRVSPRALTKTGALVHIELEPQERQENGRLFFHKIKKYIKKKLVSAAIAIILVVKLIALKLVFVLPLIMGITTAKKMFLKLLLFLFPALSHIFKLCSWYHQNYHTTKYHHHHHLITHHHKGPHHQPYGHPPGHGAIVVRPHSLGPPPTISDHYSGGENWALSGGGVGTDYIGDIHRNAITNFKPTLNDAQDINAWGLGLPPGPDGHSDEQQQYAGEYAASNNVQQNVAANNLPQRIAVQANTGRPVGPPINPYYRNKKANPKDAYQAEKEALIRAASIAARAPPSPVRDEILRVSAVKLKENNRIKTETELVKQQQQILAAQDPETIAAEKFYGTLVETIDVLLSQMGANELGCRERAVCALYGDPFKHTPYSNLVSGHLSKDSNELLPAGDSKAALHYYRYVQAARDGQEQKDCVASYPNCDIDFNRK
ncbi:DUF1676 domain-containing protein Osi17 [Anticarsia gemmatalis]|uniref:DUF1676 domain-containing protein Osi17 n=1 Tax=Anticarsia gemmatalis TaxID=129554 RepID=UPI003F758B2C